MAAERNLGAIPLDVEWNILWQSLVGDVIAARKLMDRREEKEGGSILVRKGTIYALDLHWV